MQNVVWNKDMKNYKLIIAYDGSRYYGWEHQPTTEMTIQGKLENVLSRMTDKEVDVIGAGRTDAGVHARAMVANVNLDINMTENEIQDYMNRYLPDDICVKEVREASDRFHSRYNAVGKTYRYTCYIGETKPVFDRKYVYSIDYSKAKNIDIHSMRKAADFLVGQHDYASFCSNPRMKKSTVRIVDKIDIEKNGEYLTLTFHGTGFLQHMVRILTGTLLEVGYRERTPENIRELLDVKDRRQAGFTAPAQGLCMVSVDYH